MRTTTIWAGILVFYCFTVFPAGNRLIAQGIYEEPNKYRMERVVIFEDDKPPQFIFVLNGSVGFKSVATLKAFVAKLRPGTIIEWRPPCVVMGDEPLRTEMEIKDFEAFCKSKKVKFVQIPSG